MDRRLFVTKREAFRIESDQLREELQTNLGVPIEGLLLRNAYDISGADDAQYAVLRDEILTDPVTDIGSEELPDADYTLAMEYLPGQYDQRADAAMQCLSLMHEAEGVLIKSFRVLQIEGALTDAQKKAVEDFMINPIESREKDLDQPLAKEDTRIEPVEIVTGFIDMDEDSLRAYLQEAGFSMSEADLLFVQNYFKTEEHRDPTITELRVLDTYWSDHCRHTTFETKLEKVSVKEGALKAPIEAAFTRYLAIRDEMNRSSRPVTLMDMGTIYAKYMREKGLLPDLETSPEINAASIVIDVEVNGQNEPWLLQFKNETHNHPTEIEPFGGASTCIGGAIRDPLSGRAYVYQAMRITGAADITAPLSETLPGKLAQSKISKTAAAGYASYGNQIGLAATYVEEIFHPGYVAKRMECGAVVGASRLDHVRREEPTPGDAVLLLGGATGRDGIGGATGSSKEHTETSLEKSSSEVQKGNAPEERKLQRLYKNREAAQMIKRSNDFGAGGVSVAIGEIAEGVSICLDNVPVKYQGLDGTELAISESQERMAVVIAASDVARFKEICDAENLEATQVAEVIEEARVRMVYRGQTVVDIARSFLNTSGVTPARDAVLETNPVGEWPKPAPVVGKEDLLARLQEPQNASQQGMVEMFDSTIGRSTVLLPYGGATGRTRSDASVQKLPVEGGTDTTSVLSYGFDPYESSYEPFLGSQYAVIESLARQVAVGSDYKRARLSVQEFFERLGDAPEKWGKVVKALLGLLTAQEAFQTPAIGGKDSMSGTFKEYDVPPTLVSFAVSVSKASTAISQEWKEAGSVLALLPHTAKEDLTPDYDGLKTAWDELLALNEKGLVRSAVTIKRNDATTALLTAGLGNEVGFEVAIAKHSDALMPGSLIVELDPSAELSALKAIGKTTGGNMVIDGIAVDFDEAHKAHTERYGKLYPILAKPVESTVVCNEKAMQVPLAKGPSIARPKVIIPLFPGTNCEYDTAQAFAAAGAEAEIVVLRTRTRAQVEESMQVLSEKIAESQILSLVGGFSSGDEPDGSGKFIVSVLKNPLVKEAIATLLEKDGLILGICNGFQALVKSGLLPTGTLERPTADSPTLFRNEIGRHVSKMVHTKVVSTLSPWMSGFEVGEIYTLPVSHGEGRFVANQDVLNALFANGQVASVYADPAGNLTMDPKYNPNGSMCAIESITSPDGKILGRMAHSERFAENLFQNMPGNKDQDLFQNGVRYFK